MIKAIFLLVAICCTIASAQVTAKFTYRGSATCNDTSKLAEVFVFAGGCNPEQPCTVDNRNPEFTTVFRCYNQTSDVPVPARLSMLLRSTTTPCMITLPYFTYVAPDISSCVPGIATNTSVYFATCNATSAGPMLCTGSTDCSSGCAPRDRWTGKELQCVNDEFYSCNTQVLFPPVSAPVAVVRPPIAATFNFRGSADCSDTSKISEVTVFTNGCNGNSTCEVNTNNAGFTSYTRCYNSVTEVPLPANAMMLMSYLEGNCDIASQFPRTSFVVPGIGGCRPESPTTSVYFSTCNATSAGQMMCSGSSDCSSGCILNGEYRGKELECVSADFGNRFSCKVDYSLINGANVPPTAAPVAGSSPSASPAATPNRKTSSATHIINSVVVSALSIVGLVI